MREKIIFIFILIFSFSQLWAQGGRSRQKREKVRYEYLKYQKIDFGDLNIEGSDNVPNVLSLERGSPTRHKNPLPYRKNFNDAIRRGIERIR